MVFQRKLLNDAGFPVVLAVRARNPHADFAGRVPAQHGPLLHQNDLGPVPCGRHRRAQARQAAAHHAKIRFVFHQGKFVRSHTPTHLSRIRFALALL